MKKRKAKTILHSIRMRDAVPLANGLFFAIDSKGEGRLHDNKRFHGCTAYWFTNARGACWRATFYLPNYKREHVLCESQELAWLALIRLAQTYSPKEKAIARIRKALKRK